MKPPLPDELIAGLLKKPSFVNPKFGGKKGQVTATPLKLVINENYSVRPVAVQVLLNSSPLGQGEDSRVIKEGELDLSGLNVSKSLLAMWKKKSGSGGAGGERTNGSSKWFSGFLGGENKTLCSSEAPVIMRSCSGMERYISALC